MMNELKDFFFENFENKKIDRSPQLIHQHVGRICVPEATDDERVGAPIIVVVYRRK